MEQTLGAKIAVLRLVDEVGFDPVDCGDLDDSWRQQPGTPAYRQDLDATALQRALAEADRSRIAEYRVEQRPAHRAGARARRPCRGADRRQSLLRPRFRGGRANPRRDHGRPQPWRLYVDDINRIRKTVENVQGDRCRCWMRDCQK